MNYLHRAAFLAQPSPGFLSALAASFAQAGSVQDEEKAPSGHWLLRCRSFLSGEALGVQIRRYHPRLENTE